MHTKFRCLAALLLVGSFVGCNPPAPAGGTDGTPTEGAKVAKGAGGTGTVNLQRVMSVLGLSQQVEQAQNNLQQQLNAVIQSKQAEFDKKRKEYPEKLTDDQTRELQKLANESNQVIQGVRNQAQQRMNDFNTYVINVLRNKISGPAETVAKRHQMSLILIEGNPPYIYRSPENDVTDELIEVVGKDSGLVIPPLTAPPAEPTVGPSGTKLGAPPITSPNGAGGTTPPSTTPPSTTPPTHTTPPPVAPPALPAAGQGTTTGGRLP
ncbi:MAG: OmpH family outer membrane protein [Planctomycetia bacterium]|nr:OmpH family outer membrane protein [Planctomycetia bacterium]